VTLVRFALDVPGPAGSVPAAGRVRATPTRRRVLPDSIVLPAPFTTTLTEGAATVELDATGADWCWRIQEMTAAPATRYVAVPDSATELGYEDLVDVDPATLDPTAAPEAAWAIALEDASALITYQAAQIAQLQEAPPTVGSQLVVLGEDEPRPELIPAFTLIARSVAVPPAPELDIVIETMTTVRGTTGVAVLLAIPAGTVPGDLLVAVVHNSTTGGTFTAPSGWVALQHLTAFADYRATYVFVYPVTGAAPGAPTFTASGSGRFDGAMFRVVGADLVAPVAAAGTSGSRTTNTMHVPALAGAAGALALSVTVAQATTPNQPIPMLLGAGFEKFLELPSSDGTALTRSVLVLGWLLPDGDVPAHNVVAASSIAAGGSQILAIKAAP